MSIDFSQFMDVFFEESADNLSALENLLLEFESNPNDPERLNAIFRAVHSIKGTSGMFGFDDIVRFAHSYESLLDDLRARQLEVKPGLTGLLLRAADLLKALVAAAREGPTPPELNDVSAAICAEIAQVRGDTEAAGGDAHGGDATAETPAAMRRLEVRFVPNPNLFRIGMDPLLIVRDLLALGEAVECETSTRGLPNLAALDPSECYLSWTIRLDTRAFDADIRDLFAFVEDGSVIEMLPLQAAAAPEQSGGESKASQVPEPAGTPAAGTAAPGAAAPVPAAVPGGSTAVDSPTVRVPGHALLAPGDFHMEVERSGAEVRVRLNQRERIQHHRPSVDVLFRSCASQLGRNAVAALFTGMGSDGARGMLTMRQAGARTMAQDEASCVVFGMPREAIAMGAVDEVFPLARAGETMLRLAAAS